MALRPKLIVSTILGTLAYLGLAILGPGGFAAFFSHRALIALTVVFFLLSAVAPLSAGNSSPGGRADRGKRWVLAAVGVISLIAVLCAGLRRPDGAVDHRRRCGALARRRALRCRRCVADVAGVRARPPLQRIGRDPARAHARHAWGLWRDSPSSYHGLLVGSLGWALAFRSGLGVLLTALLIPPLLARINAEERLLRSHFGDEYDA